VADWSDVEFRNKAGQRRLHDALSLAPDIMMLADFLICLGCGQAVQLLWHFIFSSPKNLVPSSATFLPSIVIGSLLLSLSLRSSSAEKQNPAMPASTSEVGAERRAGIANLALVAFGFASQVGHVLSHLWIPTWLLLFACIVGATRRALDRYLSRLEKRGAFRKAVAIVGAAGARERLVERFTPQAHIVGFCEAPLDRTGFLRQDEIDKLQELSADGRLDSIVLALEKEQTEEDICAIIERLKILPTQVGICNEGNWKGSDSTEFFLLAGVPLKIILNRPINRRDLLVKTIFDKVSAALLIVLLAPLMAAVAISIAATSRGPIIFRQTRQGWCGRQFTMFKFRTMRDVPGTACRYRQTTRKDPRCTTVGRLLRRTSFDELPQLWNVLRGDMSFVGPRPHAEMLDEVDRAGREIVAEYAQRLRVKPGITGWAQIHGARGAISTVEQLRCRVALDLYYIEHWSLWLDARIVAQTPFCMVGKNVF
jgi:exopolysaccharide biosynthesis polyprenyl glycosylphosphotransferase